MMRLEAIENYVKRSLWLQPSDAKTLLAVAKAADTLVREGGLCSCEDCTERVSALTKALAALEKETA